jgi:hypothetical protein
MLRKILAICSGYWNPLTVSHLDYLDGAGMIDTELDSNGKWTTGPLRTNPVLVIVNNDEQVKKKGSVPFMDEWDRNRIVDELECVLGTIMSVDEDLSVVKTLHVIHQRWLRDDYSGMSDRPQLIFCNGGDRNAKSACNAEEIFCESHGIEVKYGVGGSEKTRSSSELIEAAAWKWHEREMTRRDREGRSQ